MGCVNSSTPDVRAFTDITANNEQKEKSDFHQDHVLQHILGRGAFAQVHLAIHIPTNTEVAVKITDLRSAKDGAERTLDSRKLSAVEKECRLLYRVVGHKHCVQIHADFMDTSLSYIVLERCDCTLLHALERQQDIKEPVFIRIFVEMLQAIAHVHSLKIVHRDIKPDNFLCSGEANTVKLCDFGLAEAMPANGNDLKGIYGTAPFMSPEMLASQGYGPETDVWSFGVIAYVLMLGNFPYQPVDSTAKAMKAAILSGHPAPTFKPKSSLDPSGKREITETARSFLKKVLNRDSISRPSAATLLKSTWLTSPARPGQGYPSLRPMLHAAKRCGAFDVRKVSSFQDKHGVEHMLNMKQARHHHKGDSQKPDPSFQSTSRTRTSGSVGAPTATRTSSGTRRSERSSSEDVPEFKGAKTDSTVDITCASTHASSTNSS